MKPHYFEQDKPDADDIHIKMAIQQGYVPQGCLLNGQLVMGIICSGGDPCKGCTCSRNKCQGRPEQ